MAYSVSLPIEEDDAVLSPIGFEGQQEGLTVDMEVDGKVLRGMNLSGCLMFGIRVPPALTNAMPIRIIVKSVNDGYLPDFGFSPWGGWGIVSQEFVDIVEQLEPGIHQFLPIAETVDSKGHLLEKRFCLMNILQEVDAVDTERSTVKTVEKERLRNFEAGVKKYTTKTMMFIPARPKVLVLKRGIVEGRHLWRDKNGAVVGVAFSDALFEAVRSADLSPLHHLHAAEV